MTHEEGQSNGEVLLLALVCGLGRQHEVLEEEGRQIVSPREAALLVDRPRLLPRRGFVDRPDLRDVLMAQPFEEQQSDFLLRRR